MKKLLIVCSLFILCLTFALWAQTPSIFTSGPISTNGQVNIVLATQTGSIVLSPSTTSAFANAPVQFNATVLNQADTTVTWSSSNGSITSGGLYTVPSTPGPFTVTATSVANPLLHVSATVSSLSQFDGPAELPRVTYNSALSNTPTPGATINVLSTDSLQTKLNNANCGDVLLLQAGATFSGNFNFPNKGCDNAHWIQVRSASSDVVLPPEGTRLTPCYAGVASLPGRPALNCISTTVVTSKITTLNSTSTIQLADGANHYRIGPGLEITRKIGGITFPLISGTNSPTTTARDIVIDRDWVHGTAQDETTRGMFLSGMVGIGIVDSTFTDFHCIAGLGACIDAQAISGGSGSTAQGNWYIHNNFLEGAAETIIFGGTQKNSITPHDIVITNNAMFKPLIWKSGQVGFVGGKDTPTSGCPNWDAAGGGQCPFIVKNLFEIKNAQRVLFEGNVLQNTWSGFTQHGGTILIEGANLCDVPTNSNISVMDVTFRYNQISHGASGFAFTNPGISQAGINILPNCPIANISAHDNIFDDLNADIYGDSTGTWDFEITRCPLCVAFHDIFINHNTVIVTSTRKTLIAIGAQFADAPGFTFTNNLTMVNADLMVGGSVGTTNLARLNSLFANPVFTNNVLIGGTGVWPTGNFFPTNVAAIQFANYNGGVPGGDYTLLSTSPYHNAGTDGKDLGADIGAVNAHIAGVFDLVDMLNWTLIQARTTTHLTGSGNPHYSWKDADGQKWWLNKGSAGNPWDINTYDSRFINHAYTEDGDSADQATCIANGFSSCFVDPFAYKRQLTPHPVMPRYFRLGTTFTVDTPGNNTFARTTHCDDVGATTNINLGPVHEVTTLATPAVRAWGGSVGTLLTIENDHMYTLSGGIYQNKEVYYYAYPYGLLEWHNQTWNGSAYVDTQVTTNVTVTNGGSPTPNFPCYGITPYWIGGAPGAGGNIQ